jgi:hypothetical protein
MTQAPMQARHGPTLASTEAGECQETQGGMQPWGPSTPGQTERRGREQVLLAIDLKSLDSRAFNLKDIAAALIDVP